MRIQLEINTTPSALNVQKRMHWAQIRTENIHLHAALREARDIWAGEQKSPLPFGRSSAPPAQVWVHMQRKKKQDPDNRVASVKGLIDALRKIGLLRDDTDEWLTNLTVTESIEKKKRTTVIVDYI